MMDYMVRRIPMVVAGVGLVMGVWACQEHRREERPAATKPTLPATRAVEMEGGVYEGEGVRVGWPGGWEREEGEFVLVLRGEEGERISLDVPKLPAHLPGWIPMGLTVNGYLEDLKKQAGGEGVKSEELKAPALGNAVVKMERSTWGEMQETAVIAIHGDRVYILRGRSDLQHEKMTREAMDEMVGSWRWVEEKK